MKFYVILLVTYSNGTNDKVAIYAMKSEDDAIRAFYSYMGQYVDADGVASVCVEAKNNLGGVYKHDSWVKATESAEEE